MIAWFLIDLVLLVAAFAVIWLTDDISPGFKVLLSALIIGLYANGFLTGLKAGMS
jgi:hypothetical protein